MRLERFAVGTSSFLDGHIRLLCEWIVNAEYFAVD